MPDVLRAVCLYSSEFRDREVGGSRGRGRERERGRVGERESERDRPYAIYISPPAMESCVTRGMISIYNSATMGAL